MSNKFVNNVLSINSTLKNRKAINNALNMVNKRKKITFIELENVGDDLLNMGDQIIPIITKNFLEITDENILMRYLYLIEYLNFDEFVNPLVHTVLKRNLGDKFKANVVNALYNFEVDITDPLFTKIFQDTEVKFYRFDKGFFDNIKKDEDVLINAIEWFLGMPYHKQRIILNRLVDVDNPRKVEFLRIIAQCCEIELALFAIDILGMAEYPDSVFALEVIAKEHGGDPIGMRAERSLRKLNFLGVKYVPPVSAAKNSDSYTCYVSMIDSNGNYVLWVASSYSLKPPYEVLCALLNESEGIIDCFGSSQMSKKEFSNLIKKAKEEDYFVKIDFELCKKLIKNAVYQNNQRNSPLPPEFIFRKKIFSCGVQPEKLEHDFKDYDLDKIKKDSKLLSKTATLGNICNINAWTVLNRDLSMYAERFLHIQKTCPPSIVELKTAKLLEEIFHNLVVPELDMIRERLFFAATVLGFDKKYGKHVKPLLCAALNLSDTNELPFENPFIVNLILSNIKSAIDAQISADASVKQT